MGRLVQARGGISVEHKTADGRGQGVPFVGDSRMGDSERRDAASEPRCPDPDAGADSYPGWHRRRRMGAMGHSYLGSRSRSYSRSRPKDAWRQRGDPDSDAVACSQSQDRRIGS